MGVVFTWESGRPAGPLGYAERERAGRPRSQATKASNEYHFVTDWHVEATVDEVDPHRCYFTASLE